MPSHGKGVNAIDDVSFVSTIDDLTTSLLTIKKNLLRAGLFPGCLENCFHCASQTNGCIWLKKGIQRLIDSHEIMFEKTLSVKSLPQDVSITTISNTPIRITSKGLIRVPVNPRVAPFIITTLGPVPYISDKVVPWNYGAEVYYHGVKQEPWITKIKEPEITNIDGTSKVTRTRRVFSSEISPPTTTTTPICVPAAQPTTNAQV